MLNQLKDFGLAKEITETYVFVEQKCTDIESLSKVKHLKAS